MAKKVNISKGPDLTGKRLVQVNPRTRIYVKADITPEELERIKQKYNPR